LRLGVVRVPQLVAPLADFLALVQDAVHRADRAEVLPLVQKRRVDLGRGLVHKRLAVQHVEDLLPLRFAQRSRRLGPGRGRGLWQLRLTPPVERRSWHADAAARRGDAHRGHHARHGPKFFDGLHGSLPLLSGGGRGIPRISESFF